MSPWISRSARSTQPVLPDLFPNCLEALSSPQHLLLEARKGVSSMVIHGGRLDGVLLDKHQFAAHGYAWLATYVAGLQQMLVWAERLEELGQLTDSRTCCCRPRMANTWRRSPAASR